MKQGIQDDVRLNCSGLIAFSNALPQKPWHAISSQTDQASVNLDMYCRQAANTLNQHLESESHSWKKKKRETPWCVERQYENGRGSSSVAAKWWKTDLIGVVLNHDIYGFTPYPTIYQVLPSFLNVTPSYDLCAVDDCLHSPFGSFYHLQSIWRNLLLLSAQIEGCSSNHWPRQMVLWQMCKDHSDRDVIRLKIDIKYLPYVSLWPVL